MAKVIGFFRRYGLLGIASHLAAKVYEINEWQLWAWLLVIVVAATWKEMDNG